MKNIKLIIFAILILVSNNVIGQNENDITYKSVSNEEFKGISSSLDKYINDITLSQKNEGLLDCKALGSGGAARSKNRYMRVLSSDVFTLR